MYINLATSLIEMTTKYYVSFVGLELCPGDNGLQAQGANMCSMVVTT